ncbi:MAG: monovalent cation/H(+) antiporter subunit G [Bryobacterales bacterium]|nr:monovalent cation/H(+) antiporter subunit G [Bryobacterales bacterium]
MSEAGSLRDWVTGLFLVSGAFFLFVASLGVLRLPDVLIRMHALTKAGALGAGLTFVACAVHFGQAGSVTISGLTVLFLLLTAPVSGHAIGRATYRLGVPLSKATHVDEWEEKYKPDKDSGRHSS